MAESTDSTQFPFLPPFGGKKKKKSSLQGFAFKGTLGEWQSDHELLTRYPASMDVGDIEVESNKLTSIPDIWARMHLFATALQSEDHPGHTDVQREWRGLLGLICLAKTFGIRLTYVTESLPDDSDPTRGGIRELLRELLPHNYCKKLTLIFADDVLVGASSPYSFVFTPPTFDHSKIPWKDKDGRPIDVLMYLTDRSDEMSKLALGHFKAWVNDLASKCDDLALSASDRHDLHERLNDLADAIKEGPVTAPEQMRSSEEPLFVTPKLSIVGLDAIKTEETKLSELLIDSSKLRSGAKESPIVVWKSGWEEKHIVWGAFQTTDVPFPKGGRGDSLHDRKILKPWINPEALFFTESITKVPMGTGSAGAGVCCRNGDRFLLPLRQEIFDFFDATFLKQHFELEVASDGKVTATLKIPLTGVNKKAIIRREYPSDKQNHLFARDTVLLWPNIRLSDWQYYYLFAREPGPGDGHWSCEPVGANVLESLNFGDEDRSHVWRMSQLPDAVVFRQHDKTVGICIPDVAVEPVDSDKTWLIAVDFGTTNTAVSKRIETEKSKAGPLHFEPRQLILMSLPSLPETQFVLADQFMTVEGLPLKMPFPSIYQRTPGRNANRTPDPIMHGRVTFEPSYYQSGGDFGIYETRLKWEKTAQSVSNVRGFLSQVLLMAFLEARAEGVKNVKLRWTYPSAFETKRQKQFDSTWEIIVKNIVSQAGIREDEPSGNQTESLVENHSAKPRKLLLPPLTESVAVCHYARIEHNFTPAGQKLPQMTVDIGGGTTDIGIWLDGHLISQSSILLAADSMARFVKNNGPFRKFLLDTAGQTDPLDVDLWNTSLTHDQNYGSAVNWFYKRYDINDRISSEVIPGALGRPEVKRAVSLALFLMGGITYYSGLLLKSACLQSAGSAGLDIDGIDILYCGNGSRVLSWLGSRERSDEITSRFLNAGVGIDFGVRKAVHLTKYRKLEDALGALHEYDFDTKISVAKPSVIVGEEGLVMDGKTLKPEDDFAKYIAEAGEKGIGKVSFSSKLPVLRKFVAEYNNCAGDMGLIEMPANLSYEKIAAHIQESLYVYAKQPEEYSIPSAFVVGLSAMTGFFIDGRV